MGWKPESPQRTKPRKPVSKRCGRRSRSFGRSCVIPAYREERTIGPEDERARRRPRVEPRVERAGDGVRPKAPEIAHVPQCLEIAEMSDSRNCFGRGLAGRRRPQSRGAEFDVRSELVESHRGGFDRTRKVLANPAEVFPRERPDLTLTDVEVYASERIDALHTRAFAADISGDGLPEVFLAREEFVFENTYKMMREYSQACREANTKPELEIWDVGQISAVKFMLDRGYVDAPIHLQFVMGALSGMPATIGTLVFVYERAKEVLGNFSWSVGGVGKDQIPVGAAGLALGGHVRVGMEDSLYAGYGRLARSSAEQVERLERIAKEMSIQPATPDEARAMLGLKGIDKVNY